MNIRDPQIKPKDNGVGSLVVGEGVDDNAGDQSKSGRICVPFHNVTYFHAALETIVTSSKSKESPSFIWRLSKP
jgi:sporulation protein YlmC with PRC-barrel domain